MITDFKLHKDCNCFTASKNSTIKISTNAIPKSQDRGGNPEEWNHVSVTSYMTEDGKIF